MGEQWPNWIISSLADRHHFQTYFLSSFGLRAAEVPVLMMSQIWFFVWSCAIFACVFFGTHGDPNEMTASLKSPFLFCIHSAASAISILVLCIISLCMFQLSVIALYVPPKTDTYRTTYPIRLWKKSSHCCPFRFFTDTWHLKRALFCTY